MNSCPKCGRGHTGICGIPPGVTKGYGARRVPRDAEGQAVKHDKPGSAKLGTAILDKLLAGAQEQYNKIQSMLKVIPYELPEFSELLDREGKLDTLIKQLFQQIGERKSK